MQIFIDLDSRKLVKGVTNSQPVTSLDFKRGDDATLDVIYVRGNLQKELATGTAISFGAKNDGEFDGSVVVFEDDFTKSGSGATTVYTATPSFNTVPLNALLNLDSDTANDKKLVNLMGEITWVDGVDGTITSSETFAVRVHNDVIRGTEGTPTALPTPDDDWVAHGHAQSLSGPQKTQAQANIGLSASTGGNGLADSGKIAQYGSSGGLIAETYKTYYSGDPNTHLELARTAGTGGTLKATASAASITLSFTPTGGERIITVPAATGTILLDSTSTIGGAKTLSGQLTLTGQAATAGTSAMTRDLVDTRRLMYGFSVRELVGCKTYTANGGTATDDYRVTLLANATGGGYATAIICADVTDPVGIDGTNIDLSKNFDLQINIAAKLADDSHRCAILFGCPITAPANDSSDPLSGKGFGFELRKDGSGYLSIRLVCYNSSFTSSSWAVINASHALFKGVRLTKVAGVLTLYVTEGTGTISTTALLTLSGAPTSGNAVTQFLGAYVSNGSSSPSSSDAELRVYPPAILKVS